MGTSTLLTETFSSGEEKKKKMVCFAFYEAIFVEWHKIFKEFNSNNYRITVGFPKHVYPINTSLEIKQIGIRTA